MTRTGRWLGSILALMIVVGTGCGGDSESKYKQTTVKRGDLYVKVSVRGHFDSLTAANIANLQASSLVVEILVDEGDYVRKGDIMAKLSSRDRENLINTATAILERLKLRASTQGGADKKLSEQIKQAEKELAFAKEEYQIVPVLAPLDGLVSARRVNEGESVHTGKTMFVLRDRLIITCDVNEADIAKVKIGQTVEVVPDAYPTKKTSGRVASIANYGEGRRDVVNFEVKSELEEIDDKLKLGMSADVDIIIKKAEDVLYIPVEYVQFEPKEKGTKDDEKKTDGKRKKRKSRSRRGSAWDTGPGKRNFSKTPEWEKKKGAKFVLTGDEKEPTKVKVKTGFTNNIMVAITKGLKKGDTVFLKKKEKKKEKWKK